MAHEDPRQAREDFRIALTGLGIAIVCLSIIIGFASWLAVH